MLNDRADTQPDRAAEAAELYQIVYVDDGTLYVRTFTALGKLYDGFGLLKGADGNRLVEIDEPMIRERVCTDDTGPDGGPCVARAK